MLACEAAEHGADGLRRRALTRGHHSGEDREAFGSQQQALRDAEPLTHHAPSPQGKA